MIKQRLLDICKALKLSEGEFSTSIGKSRPYIANLKNDITTSVLLNIHIKYSTVNIMRIITGEGDVLISSNNNNSNNISSSDFEKKIKELELENKTLIRENGHLEGQLKEIKKLVPAENDVKCAIVSGSDLEK